MRPPRALNAPPAGLRMRRCPHGKGRSEVDRAIRRRLMAPRAHCLKLLPAACCFNECWPLVACLMKPHAHHLLSRHVRPQRLVYARPSSYLFAPLAYGLADDER